MDGNNSNVSDLPRFLAFGELKPLVKRLRMIGVDCAYDGGISLPNAIQSAICENRILLTTTSIASSIRLKVVKIPEINPDEQFKILLIEYPILRRGEHLSICLVCNEKLKLYNGETSVTIVPNSVFIRNLALLWCPKCTRIFWDGSHTERMRQKIKMLLNSINH